LRRRGLWIAGARAGVLGLALGLMYVLGWLFFKPSVISPSAEPPHGFGGLAPKLIRAGGADQQSPRDAVPSDPSTLVPSDRPRVAPPLPAPDVPMPEVKR
jgi:hypothetical protein